LPSSSQPRYQGGSVSGKRILIKPEQGYGDVIQFCRYGPLLADIGATIILEVYPPLKRLISSLDKRITVVSEGELLPDYDCFISIMSLPGIFATDILTVPSEVPYLQGPKSSFDLGSFNCGRPRIGVVWAGNAAHSNDRNRSIPFEKISPLLSIEAQFLCMQKGVSQADRSKASFFDNLELAETQIQDFFDAAGIMNTLDLIITVDTSIAHLAGALGKEVWVLLPFIPDYRWGLNRSDSPWYPSMRLYRQDRTRDWDLVISRVTLDLQKKYNL
jgi:hypothetical protein